MSNGKPVPLCYGIVEPLSESQGAPGTVARSHSGASEGNTFDDVPSTFGVLERTVSVDRAQRKKEQGVGWAMGALVGGATGAAAGAIGAAITSGGNPTAIAVGAGSGAAAGAVTGAIIGEAGGGYGAVAVGGGAAGAITGAVIGALW